MRENVAAAAPVRSYRDAGRLANPARQDFPALLPKVRDRADSLSGSQQRMLALARALVRNPSVLLLDEPTEGIQPSQVNELLEKLRALRKQRWQAILLVEQKFEVAAALADRS